MNRNEFININSISIHHKPKKISKTWKLKVNSVVHKACSKGFYLRNRLKNALLILQNLYLAQPIFKIGSLNLFSTEPNYWYKFLKQNIFKTKICMNYLKNTALYCAFLKKILKAEEIGWQKWCSENTNLKNWYKVDMEYVIYNAKVTKKVP